MTQHKALEDSALERKARNTSKQRWTTGGLFIACAATGYFLLSRLGMVMPFSQIPDVLCLSTCADDPSVHLSSTYDIIERAQGKLNSDKSLSSLLGDSFDRDKVSLLVEKSQERVTVFYDLEPIKSYDAVFGTVPKGDKRMEGDRKTPEGVFRIHDLYPHDEWSKFIWLNYPTPQSWRNHLVAKLTGEIGVLSTIGGQIGIHGVPEGADGFIDTRSHWTWGCVSLKNADVDEIYEHVTQGSIVEILP